MGLKLEDFVDKCVGIAQGRGLAADYPVTLKVREPEASKETLVVVSFNEPTNLILPLNVTWINGDSSSVDFKEPLKRVSKTSSGGYDNSWDIVETYDEIFNPPQYYAPEDNPQPTYTLEEIEAQLGDVVRTSGSTLEGPLHLRTESPEEPYLQTEAVTKGFVTAKINQQTQGFYNLMMSLMRRVSTVESLAADNKRRLDELGNIGGGSSTVSYVHEQTEASDTWTVDHEFGSDNILYVVYDESQEEIIPGRAGIVADTSNNRSVIEFAEPITGKAILIKA